MADELSGLQLNVHRSIRRLQEDGLKAEIPDAEGYYQQAREQWRASPTVESEKLWLQATIVYQAVSVGSSLEWWQPLATIGGREAGFYPQTLATTRLYALMLTNGAIGRFMARAVTQETVNSIKMAIACFEQVDTASVVRWKGCALVLLARCLPIFDTSVEEQEARAYALRALEFFKKPSLPSLSLYNYARYTAGLSDGYVPGRSVVHHKPQLVPCEPSDIFYFQS